MTQLTDKQYLDRLNAVILLRQQGYYTEAAHVAIDLQSRRPQESGVHHQLGQIHTALGNAQGAVDEFGEALRLMREHGALSTHALQFQATALGYGQSLMRLGRFEEAWPYFESGRLHVSWSPWPAAEYWDGTAENVPSLLVQAEGGYGDIFMFMRWIALLKPVKGVGRIGLMIFPGLADFCDWSALGVDEVYRTGLDKIPFGRWAYSTSIMSLPACFNIRSWDEIPLNPDPALIADFPAMSVVKQPGAGTFRIGFCWRAEENSSPIKTKSLEVEVAAEIVDKADLKIRQAYAKTHPVPYDFTVEVYSLSPEKKDLYNTDPFMQPPGLLYEPERMATWRDTAYYLCGMDYVLTVDSAAGHLCGLLGVPAMVLIPKGGCWRFGAHDRLTGPWYGESLTYYRQPEVLRWDAEDIVKALMEKIKCRCMVTITAESSLWMTRR
jgi:tetratricopeptide (TPR) repeat protein